MFKARSHMRLSLEATDHQFSQLWWAVFRRFRSKIIVHHLAGSLDIIQFFVWFFPRQDFPKCHSIAPHIRGSTVLFLKKTFWCLQLRSCHSKILLTIHFNGPVSDLVVATSSVLNRLNPDNQFSRLFIPLPKSATLQIRMPFLPSVTKTFLALGFL